MTQLALIRPHDWVIPLVVHILGAMVLVGALVLAAMSLIAYLRSGSPVSVRLAFRTLLYGALPGYVVFRIGAAWIASKEHLTNSNLQWIGIGYGVSDFGAALLIAALIVSGISVRRMGRGIDPSPIGARVVTGLVSIILIGYLVAIWAMTTKPT